MPTWGHQGAAEPPYPPLQPDPPGVPPSRSSLAHHSVGSVHHDGCTVLVGGVLSAHWHAGMAPAAVGLEAMHERRLAALAARSRTPAKVELILSAVVLWCCMKLCEHAMRPSMLKLVLHCSPWSGRRVAPRCLSGDASNRTPAISPTRKRSLLPAGVRCMQHIPETRAVHIKLTQGFFSLCRVRGASCTTPSGTSRTRWATCWPSSRSTWLPKRR